MLPVELYKLGGQLIEGDGARRLPLVTLGAALDGDIGNGVQQGALVGGNEIPLAEDPLQVGDKGELLLRGGVHLGPPGSGSAN
ncbi:MAG: hypothetical protein ACRC91_02500 [Aeromonas sp.]